MIGNDIRVRLFGGLGNQLFQYYAGMYFSQLFSSKLFLDTRWVDGGYGHSGSDLRDFDIDPEVQLVTTQTDGTLNFKVERIKTILSREIPFFANRLRLFVPRVEGYLSPTSQEHFFEARGYFQSAEYFSRLTPPQDHLELKVESAVFQECRNFLLESPFLSVHIRAGDYLKKAGIYRNLSKDYYRTAIETALNSMDIDRIVLFSDDLEYAKTLIDSRYKLVSLPEHSLRASEELVLMSLGSAFVIANSTFSYWAAFRSGQEKVFAPDSWLINKELPFGFYPRSWTRIPFF